MECFYVKAKQEMFCGQGNIKKHEILCLKYVNTIAVWDYYKEVGGIGRMIPVLKDLPLSDYFDIIEND